MIEKSKLLEVLRNFNPWWSNRRDNSLPSWKRAAYNQLVEHLYTKPLGRALLLTGARQVGKSTLFRQTIDFLLKQGVPVNNILYLSFDHPLFKLSSLDEIIKLWEENLLRENGPEFLFLDEIQVAKEWPVWVKNQVDFKKNRRLALTGSALPLLEEGQESGVGRWTRIKIEPLSFYEYLKIRRTENVEFPSVGGLPDVFSEELRNPLEALHQTLTPHFKDYLVRSGFPSCALNADLTLAQKLLREDIVDKILKRDMTALWGVRRIDGLEQLFLYLCLNPGGLLDTAMVSRELQLKFPVVKNFLELLQNAHLIHILRPHGYGKEILRSRPKIYLADPAIPSSLLLEGSQLLSRPAELGPIVENAVFRHIIGRMYRGALQFSYWRHGKQNVEIDLVAESPGRRVGFEVKYEDRPLSAKDWSTLRAFCDEKKPDAAYLINRQMAAFGTENIGATKLYKIPAELFCYFMGKMEIEQFDW